MASWPEARDRQDQRTRANWPFRVTPAGGTRGTVLRVSRRKDVGPPRPLPSCDPGGGIGWRPLLTGSRGEGLLMRRGHSTPGRDNSESVSFAVVRANGLASRADREKRAFVSETAIS